MCRADQSHQAITCHTGVAGGLGELAGLHRFESSLGKRAVPARAGFCIYEIGAAFGMWASINSKLKIPTIVER